MGLGPGPWFEMQVNTLGLEKALTGTLPPRFRDLICIAAFALGADCGTRRGSENVLDNGASWRRDFRFVVPVAEPEFWSDPPVRALLEETLGFLSDDRFVFHFVPAARDDGRELHFLPPANGRTFVPWSSIEEVMLFSGGMDSLGGAVEQCVRQKRRVMLVSHGSSPQMKKTQRLLVEMLTKAGREPVHVTLDVTRRDDALRSREETQRTRSLLFAALAGAVSWMVGRRRVRFHENGIIALNLPICGELLGARATRTAHPRVLLGFQQLLSAVADDPFTVDNPFQFMTRAQVAAEIRDAGAREMLVHSRSCAHIRGSTIMHPACGVCSQCIDRQFSMRALGLEDEDPDSMYETKLFADPLEDPQHVKLAVGYVSTAREFRKIATQAEFEARFGEVGDALPALAALNNATQEAMLGEIIELHRRHGEMVLAETGRQTAARMPALTGGNLHPKFLLVRVIEEGLRASAERFGEGPVESATVPPTPAPPHRKSAEDFATDAIVSGKPLDENTFINAGSGWVVGLRDTRPKIVPDSVGMRYIARLLADPGRDFWVVDLVAEEKKVPALVEGGDAPAGPNLKAVKELRLKIEALEARAEEEEGLGSTLAASDLRRRAEEAREELEAVLAFDGAGKEQMKEQAKAKDSVRKALDAAIKAIDAKHPALRRHLDPLIDRGATVVYRPPKAPTWRLAP